MKTMPYEYSNGTGPLLAAILFCIGLAGLLVRRNIIFMLMSVEMMLNAAGLAFIIAGAKWGQADGQVMFVFILAMTASEVSVGLALVIQMFKQFKSVDIDMTNTMKG
jgi:NADH-quinone oxidoreductase subunit K